MKVLVIVALFAFVAVQFSTAAPRPDEEKKAEPAAVNASAADSAARVPAVVPSASEAKATEPVAEGVPPASSSSDSVKPTEEKKA